MEQHNQPSPQSSSAPVACPRCGVIDRPAIGPGSGPHYAKETCRHCGGFLQWISQYTQEERDGRRATARAAAMRAKPPSPAQLNLLKALGYSGPQPQNMLEASARIENHLSRSGRFTA